MQRSGRALLVLTALTCAAGCPRSPAPPKTALEVREYQTRVFDTSDTKLVMKAMLNVLQDDGYVVKNAVVDLGLVTAQKEIDLAPGRSGSSGGTVFGGIGSGIRFGGGGIVFGPGASSSPAFNKTEVRDFTGNVSQFGTQTKVRVSFQRKVLDNRGEVVDVTPIDDVASYQDFFSRMDKGVFLQKEQL